ncbi:MAG: hypothetical protein FWC22_05325 [Treponema sp.]|nr:hypothetical protein [Treponema sp.]
MFTCRSNPCCNRSAGADLRNSLALVWLTARLPSRLSANRTKRPIQGSQDMFTPDSSLK